MKKNVADRKQKADALFDSEEMHLLIIEMCDHAILLTQPDEGYFLLANPAACRMFGYSQEELLNLGRSGIMDVTDKRWPALLKERSVSGHVRGRVRCIRRNGEVFLVEFTSIQFHDSKGRLRASVHIRDISEQESTEKELRESEMRWQFAVESHGDAMWDWDADKDELFLTAAAKELFKLPDTDSPRPMADLYAQVFNEDRALMERHVSDISAGKTSEWNGEYRLIGHGEKPFWIVTRGRVMSRTRDGRPHRIVSISRDVTQRKHRGVEARRQGALVRHQSRLVTLGELASALAHEINQPLTAITGFAAECVRKAKLPEVRDLAVAIEEQAMRAGEIAWRMRGFARRQSLGRSALSVHEVIAGVAKWMYMDHSSYPDIVIDTTGVDISLPPVDADRVELEQVFINLVRNGIEAALPSSREQRIVITAGLGPHPGEIEVCIKDWGRGLPATADLDAFQPFISSKQQGLGLGLPISFSIIEGHGGRLWATPNPEGGTIFHITLPVAGQAVPTS